MSTRIQLYSIPSMDQILDAVGSGDKKILKTIAPDTETEMYHWAEEMLSETPPKKEPGAWNYVVSALAEYFGLELKFLEVDDWSHYGTWDAYIELVKEKVSDECLQLLKLLERGRPLKGDKVEHDGCCFAWLTSDEAKQLLSCLKPIDKADVTDDDCMEMFHESLVDSLEIASKDGDAIFMASH